MERRYTPSRSLQDKRIFILILFFAASLTAHAQVRTLTGTVTTSDAKETLPGATIIVKGTSIGTVTKIDGTYSIEVPSDTATIVFSYIGYKTKEITIFRTASDQCHT